MNNISKGFSCGDDFDGKEGKAPLLYETRENQHNSSRCMDVHNHHRHHMQVEVDFEFWSVEHPLEPPDEDRPVKCPMPDSSVINVRKPHLSRFHHFRAPTSEGFSAGPCFEVADPYAEEDRGPELSTLRQAQQQQRQEASACEMSLTSSPGGSSASAEPMSAQKPPPTADNQN
ncbi:hypothetical protein TB2_035672 [Malus domestica]